MIKIEIDQNSRETIEKLHWEWFQSRAKMKFKDTSETYKDFITQNLNLTWSDVERIIKGDFSTLKSFIYRFGKITKIQDEIRYNKMMLAFGYDNFCDSKKNWNAYEWSKKTHATVCPYCNREYTFTIGNTTEKKVRPEIDHFFPKTDYPYLSCSLYNFIPSCHICNHGKREFGEGIVYPYEEGFEKDILFRVKYSQDISKTHVFFKVKHCKTFNTSRTIRDKCLRVQKSINTFHLEEIYNEHKIELQDLFTRYRNYSDPKIDEITKLILNEKLNLDGMSLTEENKAKLYHKIAQTYTKRIKRTILGLPLAAGDKQYPLRKFKEDIIEQLDNTKKKMKEKVQNRQSTITIDSSPT